MIQTLPGNFRTLDGMNGVGFSDFATITPANAVWASKTPGATQIDKIDLQPSSVQNYELVSVSIQGTLVFYSQEVATIQGLSGKLGKIEAGLILDNDPAQTIGKIPGGSTVPWDPQFEPLPTDTTLVSTLWDPNEDDFPSVGSINSPIDLGNTSLFIPVKTSIVPQNLLSIKSYLTAGIGLWMNPSTYSVVSSSLNNAIIGLVLLQPTYTVNYDNGM
jgi:hypothetical protein